MDNSGPKEFLAIKWLFSSKEKFQSELLKTIVQPSGKPISCIKSFKI